MGCERLLHNHPKPKQNDMDNLLTLPWGVAGARSNHGQIPVPTTSCFNYSDQLFFTKRIYARPRAGSVSGAGIRTLVARNGIFQERRRPCAL